MSFLSSRHLHDNQIRSLGQRCFDGLHNLETLWVHLWPLIYTHGEEQKHKDDEYVWLNRDRSIIPVFIAPSCWTLTTLDFENTKTQKQPHKNTKHLSLTNFMHLTHLQPKRKIELKILRSPNVDFCSILVFSHRCFCLVSFLFKTFLKECFQRFVWDV